MGIDPMTKMNISLVAMFFMFVINFTMIYARKAKNPILRIVLKICAFLLLIITLLMIIIVVFF